MSDAILERIATALEKLVSGGSLPATGANKTAPTKATAASGTSPKAASADKTPPKTAAAATPPKQPDKAPGGKYTAAQVLDKLRVLAKQNKELALKTINENGGGAVKFSEVKPEFYDALYEAINSELTNGDSGGSDDDIIG